MDDNEMNATCSSGDIDAKPRSGSDIGSDLTESSPKDVSSNERSGQFGVYVRSAREEKIMRELEDEIACIAESGRRFGQVDPQLAASMEQYIEQLRLRAKRETELRNAEPLSEDPRKFVVTAGNCVSYSDPVFYPNDARHAPMIARLRHNLNPHN